MIGLIEKLAKALIRASAFVAVYVFLTAMLLLMISDVFLRYFAGSPFFWSNEASTYLMIVMAFSAFPIAFCKNRHVRVRLFFDRLPRNFRNVWWVVISLLCSCYVALIAYSVFILAFDSFENKDISPTSEMLLFPWQGVAGLGLTILFIAVVMFTVKRAAIALGLRAEEGKEGDLIGLGVETEREAKKAGHHEL